MFGLQIDMSFASRSKLTIDAALSMYEAADGFGYDAYCENYICHPMADGKYLQALAVLFNTKLISLSQFQQRALIVCARIESNSLKCGHGMSWGLGFSWRNLPADETFLITSSIVSRGLLDCHCQGLLSDQAANLFRLAGFGLKEWIKNLSMLVGEKNISLPVYSPNIREPIFNAAAYALGTSDLIDKLEGRAPSSTNTLQAMQWIRSRHIVGLGWPYSPASPIVDLLHQCYIFNSLADVFGIQSIEEECIEMMGHFAGPCCFLDAIRLVRDKEELLNTRDIPWIRSLGDYIVEALPKSARLWSLGELLVLLSRLGDEGKYSEAWVRQGRQVAEMIVSRLSEKDDEETQYPRHVMHAVHGLASYLALLRKRAQKNTNNETEP
jgi:hypothetical protein